MYAGLCIGELLDGFEAFYGERALADAAEAALAGRFVPAPEPGPWPVPRWEHAG